MAKFIVETTFEVYSPKDWKFRVEMTTKFKVETTQRKLKKMVQWFREFFRRRRLKTE